MGLDVSIAVSTFGSDAWRLLAEKRSLPNARSFGVPVIYNHGKTLHEARNLGLSQVETEWICFLDADDELEPGYFDEMDKADGDLRPPAMRYVPPGVVRMPTVVGHSHASCYADCLLGGNFMCVGTVARTELLREVGGWKEWGTFEDFDLWQRCWIAGATITPVPSAVYRAYSTPQGRCRNLPVAESTRIQRMICETNLPDRDWTWLK